MLVDFFLYALIIWGLATLLNKTFFKTTPASLGAAWMLTILVFFINIFALNIARLYRYELISESIGTTIQPSHPVDFVMPVIFAYLFFILLNRRKKAKHHTQSTMSQKDVRQWAMLMALVREQYVAMRKHANGRLGNWGKARIHARQEKINKLISELWQRKVKAHGDGALDAFHEALEEIELNNRAWNNVTLEEIKFVWDLVEDMFGVSTSNRRKVEPATQETERRRAEQQAVHEVEEPDFASVTLSVTDEDIWAQALDEFEGSSRHPGLWAKAFADAQGDERLAKANYLSQRASEMLHGQERETSSEKPDKTEESPSELMSKLGIAFDGEKYHYRQFRFDNPRDAINHAQKKSRIMNEGCLVASSILISIAAISLLAAIFSK